MVGQQVIVALGDFGSSNQEVKSASKTLVETTLANIAPSLYRGASLAYADISTHGGMAQRLNVAPDELPILYSIMQDTGDVIQYNDEFSEDGIRIWVHNIIQGIATENYVK